MELHAETEGFLATQEMFVMRVEDILPLNDSLTIW